MTSPSGSTLSILRGYDPSNPRIVPFERGDYTHRSAGYTHSLREVVVTSLLVVSDCEIPKITVHSNRRGAFYRGNLAGDREAEPVPGKGEGTNLDPWLRDDVYCVVGQGYAQTFPSRDWNL